MAVAASSFSSASLDCGAAASRSASRSRVLRTANSSVGTSKRTFATCASSTSAAMRPVQVLSSNARRRSVLRATSAAISRPFGAGMPMLARKRIRET